MLAVYNICGISGRDNINYYIESLRNLVNQTYKMKIVVSACKPLPGQIERLQSEFPSVCFCVTEEVHTVNTTFNKTVLESIKRFGEFDKYLYVDSGCNPIDLGTVSYMAQYDYGMVTCFTDTDQGYGHFMCYPIKDMVIPIGFSCNLHFQIFHGDIQKRFGRILPDIFRSFCTESVFPFLNAAVGKEWIYLTGKTVQHIHSMDGASSGFTNSRGWMDTFVNPFDLINDPEGTECGFEYEECNKVKMHKADCYEGNFCKDPERLARFLENHVFLDSTVLNYDNINTNFILGSE